ncbi:MAG: CHAD domain-containing protein [Candidatus Dormibacteraeota bacterium]|uniref:CHAD domain-containing protein n=1 Tax=Candidatus Aeolococcus gillhamiae TaxID=3127015 RepID=A0A934K049_9BACT|nr:CHAD domain-containing protein [Candidatus Dormibacteraeota bacterium]
MADRFSGTRIRVPLETSVPRLLIQAGYKVTSSASSRSTRSLFDTGDRRLAAGGGELSLNRRDGWRWRRDTLGHPKLTSREWSAPSNAPQAQLLDWTRAYRRGRPVAERAVVTIHSRRHTVASAHADSVLTLVEERLDEHTQTGATPRLRHVQVVEAGANATSAIAVLAEASVDDAPALALLGRARARAPRLRIPDPSATEARDVFTRSTTLSLIQWLYFDGELPAGSPEALRKLRVALRRLRSDLQTFAPLLDREWADGLRDQLGRQATRLGVVRDLEVLGDRLAALVALLPEAERPAALPLLDTAGTQLAAARVELLDELGRAEYLEVLDRAVDAVTAPRWKDGDGDPRATRLARRPWRRLRSYVEALSDTPDDAELHRVRILAKRARYAADACVPAAGAPAAECAAQLAALQTVLGEHHDGVTTRDWLQREAEAMSGVSFIAGELAALELPNVRRASKVWRDEWAKISPSRNWRWLRS